MAPEVARIMARDLGYDDAWKTRQIDAFVKLAENYLVASPVAGASLP